MAATGTISDITPLNSMDIETSLHLLAVLMRQGNPAGLAELALRSPLAPDLVKNLCQILRSPLKFTSGGFMSSSDVAVAAFEEFMTRAVAWFVPRDTFRDSGLRRGRWNVSVTYARKRKAPSSGNTSVLLSRSKRRTLMFHERDEGDPMKVEGLPKLSSRLNEIPGQVLQENFEVASPFGNDWHSVGLIKFDCSVVGLDQAYNFPVTRDDLSCFESRNISYTKQEDTRAGDDYIPNSTFPHKKVDLYEQISPDVGLDANIIKEQALQRLMLVEPDCRPLLDQTSPVNQTLGEDCNTISLELDFFAGIPETPVLEKPNDIELNFGTSLMDRVLDQTALDQLDYNNQSASSTLAYSYQQVAKVVNERKLDSKDDALITVQLETKETPVDSRTTYFHRNETSMLNVESRDVGKNSAVIAEDKQWTFSELSRKDHIALVEQQNLMGSNIASNSTTSSTKEHNGNFQVGLIAKQKVKNVCNVNLHSKENKVHASTKISKNSSDQKLIPNLESFIIEEEEGSGGYGTVYKAKRKDDGKIFAVKCPHANANSHHVYNELKMLERFGGRNFVIKYECSFKNEESECFVLEHVEHDRPEVLKKEIGMFELQWYGFCMFKALASLHKQGVVHRDVKPGNFLFSRKVNKGYLIDFNLASDLQQKFCRNSKRKMPTANVNSNSLPESKSKSNIHSRKFIDLVLLENAKKETANESKKILTSKSSKKKAERGDIDGFPIVDRSKQVSQTADGSGLTSTKDQTSNRTPVDWLKQPIPCKGRKELINFVHKAMHSPQNFKPVSNGPSSQRKRVAAPMTKTDTRLLILTPMPLQSGGNPVAGAGILRNKASGKVKREGPCVGTKGFRAPEVLFKSFHQGCKIDIWSAGVTMLYLMIGRAPFGGDPEQNIKEIAKLRGSEDLWEVAKLHNCESSFPVDLLEVGSLKSMELSDWCAKNTRRPEFLELIHESLFDLVDKCLAVNPRRRFSAEEALMHKFFAPCHESIRKQRLLRKVVTTSSDPSSSSS